MWKFFSIPIWSIVTSVTAKQKKKKQKTNRRNDTKEKKANSSPMCLCPKIEKKKVGICIRSDKLWFCFGNLLFFSSQVCYRSFNSNSNQWPYICIRNLIFFRSIWHYSLFAFPSFAYSDLLFGIIHWIGVFDSLFNCRNSPPNVSERKATKSTSYFQMEINTDKTRTTKFRVCAAQKENEFSV